LQQYLIQKSLALMLLRPLDFLVFAPLLAQRGGDDIKVYKYLPPNNFTRIIMNKRLIPSFLSLFLLLLPVLSITHAQETDPTFYFGVDLSYVNEMDDCGAVYRENGEVHDPFTLFADHGANLVRARLWHNPDWTDYSTLEDVKRTFRRAQDQGMSTLLDFHYSDNWADPGRQEIPVAWEDMDDEALVTAVYDYTTTVLTELAADDLIPALVQVGNETNSGMLKRGGEQDWSRDATLFNAGIRAVRDFTAQTGSDTRILLHVAQPQNTTWWFTQAEAAGITDFDVIGISYYPQWSEFSIADLGAQVTYLRQRFGKQVMVLETGYGWSRDAVDESASNILNQGQRGYAFTPEDQLRFMTDLTQTLISNGAIGVVYWEPAWVSTECLTRWGQGSHWENATFFDFQNENEVLPAINFLRDDYLHLSALADAVIEDSYGDPLVADATADVFNDISSLDLDSFYLQVDESTLSLALSINGDIFAREGNYFFYLDTIPDQGAAVDVGRRPITVADPYQPEFRLDVSIVQEGENVRGSYTLNAWVAGEWQEITFTGGTALAAGEISVIELILPRVLLGDPQQLNIAVLSTDRGRVHTAADVLGSDHVPASWDDALILDTFFTVDLVQK
jgi:arabinogalactan endo-1,4-beta-galactosidase